MYICVCVLPVTLCGHVHLCEYRHKVVTLIILDKGLGREGEMRNSWLFSRCDFLWQIVVFIPSMYDFCSLKGKPNEALSKIKLS